MYWPLRPDSWLFIQIKTKALDLVVEEYKTGNADSWAKRETNWNVVCNTGMVLGALAIEEHYPELAKHIIGEAVRYIPNCLKHFGTGTVFAMRDPLIGVYRTCTYLFC